MVTLPQADRGCKRDEAALNLVSLGARNLARRPIRTALTMLGVATAMAGLVALIGVSRGFSTAWRNSLDQRGGHLIVHENKVADVLSGSLPIDMIGKVRAIPGVKAVAAELIKLAPIDETTHALIIGWNTDAYLWKRIALIRGRPPRSSGNEIVLGREFARALNKKVGDEVTLLYETFTIVGLSNLPGVMNSRLGYMNIRRLQVLMDRPRTVTIFNVQLERPDDPSAVAAVKARIAALGPRFAVSNSERLVHDNEAVKFLQAVAWTTSIIALTIGLLAVINTMYMSVSERRPELALLVTLGWPIARIALLIAIEGFMLTVSGAVIGAAVGWFAVHVLAYVPALHGLLAPDLTIRLVLEIAITMVLLGVFGGLFPSLKAARSDPEVLLRTH